jgi:hypothetical protein
MCKRPVTEQGVLDCLELVDIVDANKAEALFYFEESYLDTANKVWKNFLQTPKEIAEIAYLYL